MITTPGKLIVKRYLAGQTALANSIAVGVGSTAEALTDTRLAFGFARFPVDLVSYDFTNNLLVFKGTLPDDLAGKIYECGLFTAPIVPGTTSFGSMVITSFDSLTETWVDSTTGLVDSTYDTVSGRIGIDGLLHTPAASTTKTSSLRDMYIDLSGYASADFFSFAFNVANANTSGVTVRFLTDASNYYSFNLGTQTAGYRMVTATKSTATANGTPNWNNITEIQVSTTSGAGGASSVTWDGIRIEVFDIAATNILVARKVIPVVTKELGKPQEFEYALAVTV